MDRKIDKSTRRLRLFWMVALVVQLGLVGCSGGGDSGASDANGQQTATTDGGPGVAGVARIAGEIVETMDSGGYTYARVHTAAGDMWTAGPVTAVTVGQTVDLPATMKMTDFRSGTLDRTFETIYFVASFETQGAPTMDQDDIMRMAHGGRDIGAEGGGTSEHTRVPADDQIAADIERAPGGKTVAEVYAAKSDLAGKRVKLRGVVVKFTPSIMGRNWVHLQDGTCDGESCDLTATTSASVKVGDVIMIEGVLAVDKDFGAGYRYAAIIEDAKLTTD